MSENNMVGDLAKAQGEIAKANIKKVGKSNFGTFVTLDAIHEAVLPIISTHNLAWVTLPIFNEAGEPMLEYRLLHTSGESISGTMRLFIGQNTAQGQGSALTYAKRYAICAVLGVTADDDDDGTAASKQAAPAYKKKEIAEVSPEEPSRQITDEPISEMSRQKVRLRLGAKGYTGPKVTEFVEFIINKPAPTTEADAAELLKALETK